MVTKDKHKVYYTKGVYEYYHYGDQSFNDQGWGCAYRALQTLLSWFDLQDYICLGKMPTIPEFQVLIDSIDYARKLKNTQEWIGAIEVSWTIKKITGYDCRIINVSTG